MKKHIGLFFFVSCLSLVLVSCGADDDDTSIPPFSSSSSSITYGVGRADAAKRLKGYIDTYSAGSSSALGDYKAAGMIYYTGAIDTGSATGSGTSEWSLTCNYSSTEHYVFYYDYPVTHSAETSIKAYCIYLDGNNFYRLLSSKKTYTLQTFDTEEEAISAWENDSIVKKAAPNNLLTTLNSVESQLSDTTNDKISHDLYTVPSNDAGSLSIAFNSTSMNYIGDSQSYSGSIDLSFASSLPVSSSITNSISDTQSTKVKYAYTWGSFTPSAKSKDVSSYTKVDSL